MKTIRLEDGSVYVPVKERLLALRAEGHNYDLDNSPYPYYNAESGILGWAVKSTLTIHSGPRKGTFTGNAYEAIDANDNINRSNALENAETSAVGRALGMAGIGIEDGIASYEEIVRAKSTTPTKGNTAVADALKMIELKRTPAEAKTKNPELHENAVPSSLEGLLNAGKLDDYLKVIPFEEFQAVMIKYKINNAPRLKRDTAENREKFITALKSELSGTKTEEEPFIPDPEENTPTVEDMEALNTPEAPKEVPVEEVKAEEVLEEPKPEAKEVTEDSPITETYAKTGNRFGIEVPLVPQGSKGRGFKEVSQIWKQIEKAGITYETFEKLMSKIPHLRDYEGVEDALARATQHQINQALNFRG
jgi:hypothetical protein